MIKGNTTFAIEGHECGILGTDYILLVEDGHGNCEPIAWFIDKEAMAQFTRTLDLAKLSAHASGRSGI